MSTSILFITFIILSVVSYFLVSGILRWTSRRKILDIPNERSSHDRPVPKGGGISIVLLTIGGVWIFYFIYSSLFRIDWIIYFTLGGLLTAVISLIDDIYSVRNIIRFFVHSLTAVFIIAGIGYINEFSFPLTENLYLKYAGVIVTFLFITGLTNAYNFMDGIDGIAAIQAIVAGAGWLLIGYIYSDPLVLILGLFIAASSMGFLFHNWHPAKIFMGDVGSAFLGFVFAVLIVISAQHDPNLLFAGVLFVWPFLFDTVYTLFRRLSHGENIFEAHRSHLYQRLVIAGWEHGSVATLYGVLAFAGWVPVMVMLLGIKVWYMLTFFIPIVLFILLLIITTQYEKRYA